jgi:hypothetical protein
VSKFLEGEQGDVETPMEWNTHTTCPHKKDIKNPSIKNNLGHTWYNAMIHAFEF